MSKKAGLVICFFTFALESFAAGLALATIILQRGDLGFKIFRLVFCVLLSIFWGFSAVYASRDYFDDNK